MNRISRDLLDRAYQKATAALKNAYAPYSRFSVAAALYLPREDEFFAGVNIENASFGGTICAERSALAAAISMHGKIKPEFLLIYTATEKLTPPCGICRQFILEFVQKDFPVVMSNHNNHRKIMTMSELLPEAFSDFEGIPQVSS